MQDLIRAVEIWGEERGLFDQSSAEKQALKMVSEVGELCDDLIKGKDVTAEMGDVLVTLVLLAKHKGITLQAALENAFLKINARTGKMINGTFVKDGD